eukprot:436810_1
MEFIQFASWFSRIIFTLLFFILLFMFRHEPSKRRMANEKNNHYHSIYEQLLSITSIAVIALCIVTSLLMILTIIPNVCIYVFCLIGFLWSMIKYTLTLYQIGRLQYTFSSQQIHSVKYSYSRCTFIILYMFFILNLTITIYISFIIIQPESIDKYGCIAKEPSDEDTKYVMIGLIFYAIWDWTVLSMYIYKVIQIYFKTNFEHEQIYKRIYFVLKKIVFLTLLYEIATAAPMIDTLLIRSERTRLLTHSIAWFIDILASGSTIYLMIEHNNDDYLKFIEWITCKIKLKIHNEASQDPEIDIVGTQHHNSIFETKDISTEVKRTEFVDQSEVTATKSH